MNYRFIKLNIVCLSIILTVFGLITFGQAQSSNEKLNEYKNAKSQEQKLEKVIQLGIDMVDRRLTSLDQLKNILNQAMKLSPAVKESLIERIDGNTAGLIVIKTDIQQDTDFTAVREKVRSIISGYRIYAVSMPQIRGLAVVDRLRIYQERLDTLKVRIQAKTDEAQAAGRNVDTIQNKLNQATEKLSNGVSFLATAERDFTNMKIDDINTARDLFLAAKKDIQNARESFNLSKNLLRDATNALWEIK